MKPHNYLLPIFVTLLTFCGIARAEDESAGLAECMPATTPVFVQLDVKKLVKAFNKASDITFADESEGLKKEISNTIENLKKLAKQEEFNPEILNHLDQLKAYIVLQFLDKPITTTHKYQTPKYDKKTYKRIKGEFEEHTSTSTEYFARALVIETPSEEIAGNFVEVLKTFLQKKQEEFPESKNSKYINVEVESGQLIRNLKSDEFVGSKGKYLYVTDFHNELLWNQIDQPTENNMTNVELYQQYQKQTGTSLATAIVDIPAIVTAAEKNLTAMGEEGKPNKQLEAFQKVSKLFSLKKMKKLGAHFSVNLTDKKLLSVGDVKLTLDEGISPLLKAILNGGAALNPPKFVSQEIPALMYRLGLEDILNETLKSFDPKTAMMINIFKGQFEQQAGITVEEIVKSFSGEHYLFFDLVDKKYFEYDWNSEDNKMKKIEKFGPQPEVTFFMAVNDSVKFNEMLTQLYSKIAVQPGMSSHFKKQVYQETVTYVFGADMAKKSVEDTDMAVALIGRYFTVGQWKEVTALIRKARSTDSSQDTKLSKLTKAHSKSNILGIIPPEFEKKLQKKNESQFKTIEGLIKKIQKNADKTGSGDNELEQEIQKSFVKVLKIFMRASKKAQERISTTTTLQGELKEHQYQLQFKSEGIVK